MGDLGQDIKQNPWALPSALALGGSAGLLRSGGLIGTPVGAVLGGLGAYGLGYGERSSQRKSQQKLADALKNIDPNATYPQIVQTVVGGGGDLKDADEFWKGMHPKATPDHRAASKGARPATRLLRHDDEHLRRCAECADDSKVGQDCYARIVR